jgi:hypothetical protein
MDVKQELRRVRREIEPTVRAGLNAAEELGAELKRRVEERLDRRDQPKIVYICSRGCFGEDEIRQSIEASRKAFRAGMVPACPHVMFPTDADSPIVKRKMKYRLMDACDIFLICGNQWTDEMWLEIRHAIMRGMEIRTDHDVDHPVIPARHVIFTRRNAVPLLMSVSAGRLAA